MHKLSKWPQCSLGMFFVKSVCMRLFGTLSYNDHLSLLVFSFGFFLAAKDLLKCPTCQDLDKYQCSSWGKPQICSLDPESLGTTHCGSVVGEYRNRDGGVKRLSYRGCFNCEGK